MEYLGAAMAFVAAVSFMAILVHEPERICHDCLSRKIKTRWSLWSGSYVCRSCGSLDTRTIPRRRGKR